jgi:hypothetical protein
MNLRFIQRINTSMYGKHLFKKKCMVCLLPVQVRVCLSKVFGLRTVEPTVHSHATEYYYKRDILVSN